MEENNFKLLYLVLISKLKIVLSMSPKTLKMNLEISHKLIP